MSWQAVEAVMQKSKTSGSSRLALMVIATHADKDDFSCAVGVTRLADEANVSERTMQYAIQQLERQGSVRVERGTGRGHTHTFTITLDSEKTEAECAVSNPRKVKTFARFTEDKGCNLTQERVQIQEERVQLSAERVQIHVETAQTSAPEPIEPVNTTKKKPEEIPVGAVAPIDTSPKSGRKRKNREQRNGEPVDERSNHPAIQQVRMMMSRYPDKLLWDDIIATLGDKPDTPRLTECRKAWITRGYNGNAVTWALDWYRDGIPQKPGRAPTNGRPNSNADTLNLLDQMIEESERANGSRH